MDISRRNLLKSTASLSVLASMGLPSLTLASPSNDYRALICVYLSGGNDAINTVLPLSDSHYQAYKAVRSNLAVERDTILSTHLTATDNYGNEVPLGLHPSLSALQPLFERGDANVVLNSGILERPLSKSEIEQDKDVLPTHLFSHNSQRNSWLSGGMPVDSNLGWAGRMLDVLSSQADVTPLYSIHGDSLWLRSVDHTQTVLKQDRVLQLTAINKSDFNEAYAKIQAIKPTNLFGNHFNTMTEQSMLMSQLLARELKSVEPVAGFSKSSLGKQLNMVFKLISRQNSLSQQRQIFFVKHTGYDMHDAQLTKHPSLLKDLSENLSALYQALDEQGLSDNVTTFTMSDFGRRMTSNGNGTDHGWGGHQLVIGGAVKSTQPIGTWPELVLGGEDDYSNGRLIPKIAADQVGATLAQWMGISDGSALDYVFPNIRNFSTSNLGFMA